MEKYSIHIKSRFKWFDIDLKELWQYRDLALLFVKRNYSTRYKQTILGPLWLILNPLLTVTLYAFVFGNIAGLSTDGAPQFLFYLSSNSIWAFFATCIMDTANTFTGNAAIMGKVYFPRLIMPISAVLTGFLDFLIQIVILIIAIGIYTIMGIKIDIGRAVWIVPILIMQTALLGLGCGIIIAACTTKYRDLAVLVSFGVQLWMYASPVVYTVSNIPIKLKSIYMCNPMATIITTWRYSILGIGEFSFDYWVISWIITIILLVTGIVLFNHIEKTFMDTV